MKRIEHISLLFSLLFTTLLFAQRPELSVKLSKNKLGVNQRVRVEFSINKQGADNFEPPEFKNFRIIAGPSQSVSQSWINGKVKFSQSYTYILQPTRKGELIIGPASIQLNGDTINSKMMKLVVVDAVDIPKDPNDPNYIAQQNIHLVAEISKSRPYVGEGIYVEYRLYVSENVSVFDTSVTEAPQYNGFWNQEIKINGYPVKMGKYNGEDYRYIVLQKALLIPTKTGNLVIDPMKMDIVIGVPTRNWFGQLLEHSPFCERDLRQPQELETYNENGDFLMKVKKQDEIIEMVYASHPFDVVGYDGYNYPYAFSIHDFEPITGRVHQPPPVHQTFETDAFVVCSFVPRLYDYHPQGIPAPYNHSNIDSDEVLYYVDGDFMSRNDIEVGHISLHPAGIPHGPHPGATERSIGQTETEELAVMVDTFKPLKVTEEAMKIADEDYFKSWLE